MKSNTGELNIGTGIFIVPAIILEATGSVGASLLLWFFVSILSMCGLFVWLEMGLGVPKFPVRPKDRSGNIRPGPVREVCTPRNGGEKNYVSAIVLISVIITLMIFSLSMSTTFPVQQRVACTVWFFLPLATFLAIL